MEAADDMAADDIAAGGTTARVLEKTAGGEDAAVVGIAGEFDPRILDQCVAESAIEIAARAVPTTSTSSVRCQTDEVLVV
jgi:hypothetical protein